MPSTATVTPQVIDQASIRTYLAQDLDITDCYLRENIKSPVPLVNQMTTQLVQAGGKRIRPMLALLIAKLFNYQGKQHGLLAAVIELLHSATLLHDDVVDQSSKRRGSSTAHHQWGNKAAILVGDFLYARCFNMLASLDTMPMMRIFANASSAMAKGEILQLTSPAVEYMHPDQYLSIIELKTAHLFMAACKSAAILSAAPPQATEAAKDFGLAFGMAYQLIDDCLDYSQHEHALDKNTGDDLAEGKCTLPILYALAHANSEDQQTLKAAIAAKNAQQLDKVKNILHRYHAIEHSQQLAQQYSQKALQSLQAYAQHEAYPMLAGLVQFNLERCN